MIHKLIFEQEPRVPKKVQCLRRVLVVLLLLICFCYGVCAHTNIRTLVPAGERTRGHRRVVADMRARCGWAKDADVV